MHDAVTVLKESGDHPLMYAFPQGAVFAFDPDLRYLAAGGLGLADVGLSREAMEGRTIFEVFPAETAAAIEPYYRAALDGTTSTLDVPFQGHVYTQRLAPVRDGAGVVVAGIGFTQDVTEARRVEHALRESEQRNRLSFTHAPVGKAIVELDGRWRQVNAAVVELTGYSEDQLLGMTFQDITHPDDLQLDLDHLARLVAGEIPSYRMEKRYITASGRIVHVLLAVSLVRDEAGDPQYFIAQIQDITELIAQRQALEDLTSMLSHDLRTATTVVTGFSDLLLTSWPELDDAERERHLRRIHAASRAMQVLLDNSLTAATLDAGQLTANPEDVRLGVVLCEVLEALAIEPGEVDTSLAEPVSIRVDPVHLQQILSNLISNARKYGGGKVRLGSVRSGAEVVLSVEDDGPGVDPEFVPHLFDRFSRAPSSRGGPQRGTGLGLSIVRDLVAMNAGIIEYAASSYGGARFVVRLPAAEDPTA